MITKSFHGPSGELLSMQSDSSSVINDVLRTGAAASVEACRLAPRLPPNANVTGSGSVQESFATAANMCHRPVHGPSPLFQYGLGGPQVQNGLGIVKIANGYGINSFNPNAVYQRRDLGVARPYPYIVGGFGADAASTDATAAPVDTGTAPAPTPAPVVTAPSCPVCPTPAAPKPFYKDWRFWAMAGGTVAAIGGVSYAAGRAGRR